MAKRPAKAAAASPALHSLVEILWMDACFDLDRALEPMLMKTVGYLIRQTPEFTVVAGESSSKMDYFRAYTTIPAGMIQAISSLRS